MFFGFHQSREAYSMPYCFIELPSSLKLTGNIKHMFEASEYDPASSSTSFVNKPIKTFVCLFGLSEERKFWLREGCQIRFDLKRTQNG